MKALIILSLALVSFNVFAAEVGEEQKSPCPYASQTNKREAKVVVAPAEEIKQEAAKTISK
ncbi:MAG: hypothetical protein H7336_01430 [Bacteriovorax sp.]|nr:hypothetical protein [Bacteriovorax sp.]